MDTRFCLVFLLSAVLLLTAAVPASAQGEAERVRTAIQRSIAYLRQKQRPGGEFPRSGHAGGTTALCTLALLHAGVPADDPAVLRAIDVLNRVPNAHTYVVSLKAQVYAAADPVKYRQELTAAAQWLVEAQAPTGQWSYGPQPKGGDNSNTQFALLGLHEAANAGVPVPRETWLRSARHFRNTQDSGGGWGYRGRAQGYGSMTAAGLASMFICGQEALVGADRRFVNGAYPGCGMYRQDLTLAKGIEWMSLNFSVRENPGKGGGWYYYYMYGMERCGMIAGLQTFGPHDWYRLGAAQLVARQDDEGSWGNKIYDSALGLLFLAKGNRPVLIQKVNLPDSIGRNVHALENFTSFLGDRLGKRVTWQTTSLDKPLQELRMSPVLLITGHEFPKLTPGEVRTLKQFVEEAGGTLLFEACCGSPAFRQGFEAFAKETWPEYTLRPLAASHPVFRSLFELKNTYGLQGLDTGCRTGVFYSPNALTCLWELADVPEHSERAFQIGGNIAAYATGRNQLADKLDVVKLPPPRAKDGERNIEVPRGAIRLARLIHQGDYNADPRVLNELAEAMRDKANMDVVARSRHIQPTDPALYEFPVIFMTGHFDFRYDEKQTAALRDYLNKGGTLVISNCCGKEAFDKAVRRMCKQILPDHALADLPADHPIYTGKVGIELGELQYRPMLAKELGQRGTTRPPILAAAIDGRAAILYSPFDWCCSFEGDKPYSCWRLCCSRSATEAPPGQGSRRQDDKNSNKMPKEKKTRRRAIPRVLARQHVCPLSLRALPLVVCLRS